MEVILYSKECNWYTRCCPLNGGVRYRECPLREAILYYPSSYWFCNNAVWQLYKTLIREVVIT